MANRRGKAPKPDDEILKEIENKLKSIDERNNKLHDHSKYRAELGCLFFSFLGVYLVSMFGVLLYNWEVCIGVIVFWLLLFIFGLFKFPYTHGIFNYSTVHSSWFGLSKRHEKRSHFLPGIVLIWIPVGGVIAYKLLEYTTIASPVLFGTSVAILFGILLIRLLTNWEWEEIDESVYVIDYKK